MKIIIGGDFVISDSNKQYFKEGHMESIFSRELLDIWLNSDFRAFNLEEPIINGSTGQSIKIAKSGPHLFADINCINGINKMHPSLLFLANNHIKDFGTSGIYSTLNILKDNYIESVGVGSNVYDAQNHSCYIKDDVAFINCCEHEFSVATSREAGANPFETTWIFNTIKKMVELKKYIIVIYHGGKEEYPYPTPELKERCELMVEFGANLVLCQHSHCIGSYEQYKGSTILFGQGNFLFKDYKNNDFWKYGLLLLLDTVDKGISFIPIKNNSIVELLSGDEKDCVMMNFEKRSKEIMDNSFVETNYRKYSEKKMNSYLCNLFSYSKIRKFFEIKVFRGRLLKKKLKTKRGIVLMNLLECEPHNEILRNVLRGEYEKNNK